MLPFAEIGVKMKVIEAINEIDNIKPNIISQSDKLKWLKKLDGMIKIEIIDRHEGGDDTSFVDYNEYNMDSDLIVRSPYDDIYIKWLEMQIDYANNEYLKYNNSAAAFDNAYERFSRQYHRTHMPKSTRLKFI